MKNFAQFSYLLFCLALFLSLFFENFCIPCSRFDCSNFYSSKSKSAARVCLVLALSPGLGVCHLTTVSRSTCIHTPSSSIALFFSLSLCLLFAQNTPRPGSTSHSSSTFEWSIPSSTCTFPAKSNEILCCLRLKFKFYMHERMKESNEKEKERECERNENKR